MQSNEETQEPDVITHEDIPSKLEVEYAAISSFRDKTEEIENQLNTLLKEKEQFQASKGNVIRKTNMEAMEICSCITRTNFLLPENQQRIKDFCLELNIRLELFNIEDKLNANCYLIWGLDLRNRDLYNQSLEKLQITIDKSKSFADSGADMDVYPGKSLQEIRSWNRKLVNIALYHAAIIQYNLGEYEKAAKFFQNSLDYVPTDVKSMIYIPEAKFLGHLEDFPVIIEEFESTAHKIDNFEDPSNWSESKDSLLSQLYLRLGNCYYTKNSYEPYLKFRSLKASLEYYNKAYTYNPKSYITVFSYAQVLKASAYHKSTPALQKIENRKQHEELFKRAFILTKEKLSYTSESKILMMLYYLLAICCSEIKIKEESPKSYLLEIYKEASNLSSKKKITIFSPLTKNNLSFSDFLIEVQEFEI